MTNLFTPAKINISNPIRTSILGEESHKVIVGGQRAYPFVTGDGEIPNKPKIAVEIFDSIPENYPELLLNKWNDYAYNPVEWAIAAKKMGAELIALRLASMKDQQLDLSKLYQQVKEIIHATNLPLILLGINNRELDKKCLPQVAEKLGEFSCIIGAIEEETYKDIIPACRDNGHHVIARTPIDVNLAKQLNILISEMGFDSNKILMDPNMGGLGYGLDYAYSVVEKIRLAAFEGDKMLNMPIIVFSGEEAWRTKEAKSNIADDMWGEPNSRSTIWELLTTSSMLMAGADIVIMRFPPSIKYLSEFAKGIKL